MAVNEVRERLKQQLENDYGVEGAAILMDRPPGGWSDLVTRDYLDAKLDAVREQMGALRSDLKADMATLGGAVDRRLRSQTWITTGTLVAGLTLAFTAGRLA
ncbi:MAG: hypothetical protein ACR2IR_11380 [Acidimicrobiia bacterium]